MLAVTMMTGRGINISCPVVLRMMLVVTVMVILQVSHHQAVGFNLWTERSLPMEGPAGSKFGYSVALWSDAGASKRLVIGAPRGKIHPSLFPDEYELGNIFLCDLRGQCAADERLPIVNRRDGSEQAINAGFSMRKYGMGFGETLNSLKEERSPLAACAPRYPRKRRREVDSRGACFILQDTNSDPMVIVPHKRKDAKYKTIQNALMGFSAALISNKTNPTIVIGGPGAFYGEGMVTNIPLTAAGPPLSSRLANKDNRGNLGATYEGWQVVHGMFDGQKTAIVASVVNYDDAKGMVKFYPRDIQVQKYNPNNYLKMIYGQDVGAKYGYSLGVGDFNGDGVDDLLVGSPWAPVKKPRYLPDAGKVFVYYSPLLRNEEAQEILGSDDWGNFGISATGLGDINMDGYDDAAVAAPHAGSEEGGIVYVYNGSPGGLIEEATQVLRASDFSPGMRGFGFSLDGGIDMDTNGYPDVFIGAVGSNEAVFLRSAPVVTLVGSVSFQSDDLKVDNMTCDLEQAGYKKVKGVCFYLDVDLRYSSHILTSDIDVELRMKIQDSTEPPQFVFKVTNDIRYTRPVTIRNIKEKPIKIGDVIFAKSDRSIIGKPVKVSVSVHLREPEDSSADDLELPPVPPVLDALSQTTFNTAVILTCDDNITCFSRPDMAVSAFPTTLVVGKGPVGIPVLLEVRNDPAYEVKITVDHPPSISYQRVDGDGIIPQCLNKGFIGTSYTKFICSFDFLEADEKVNFTLFFDYQPLKLMDYLEETGEDHLTIDLTVESDSKDTDVRDNKFASKLQVNTEAILYTVGESLPEAKAVKVNQTMSMEEIQRAQPPDSITFPAHRMGPKITQYFSLTNRGPSPVKGAKLELQLVLFRGDQRVLYLLEDPILSEGINCGWPVINPWNLQDTEPEFSRALGLTNSTDASQGTKSRKRRQTKGDQGPGAKVDQPSMSSDPEVPLRSPQSPSDPQNQGDRVEYVAPMDHSPPRKARSYATPEGTKYIGCDLPECQVTCDVDLLDVGQQVSIAIPGYLVIASLDKHGHRKLGVRSWVTAKVDQQGSHLINPSSSATTFVTLLKPAESGLSAVPFWLLLMAVLGSILLILLIVALLYRAGFFKRNRPPVDPNRKSLVHSDYPPPAKDLQEIAAMTN